MEDSGAATLLGIDWGTSNRRAWWLGPANTVLAEHADDQGLLAVRGGFAQSLAELLHMGPPLARQTPIVMSGMVGSAGGWLEAPYLDASTPLAQLSRHLVPLAAGGPRCFIVPGLCRITPDGGADVMRGEETQLLGALALGHGDGWYVLPGTHSKWVQLRDGCVADFATYMTGELFSLLSRHGTLAGAAAAGSAARDGDSHPFERGVAAAGRSGLSNALFGCRAQVVAGRMPAAHMSEYLSGLLIGAEWHDVSRRTGGAPQRVGLIGSPELAQRYAGVAALFGCHIDVVDSRGAQLAALGVLRAAL
jgi:2-dehydro-3-deoxygalactonokinase